MPLAMVSGHAQSAVWGKRGLGVVEHSVMPSYHLGPTFTLIESLEDKSRSRETSSFAVILNPDSAQARGQPRTYPNLARPAADLSPCRDHANNTHRPEKRGFFLPEQRDAGKW